MNEYMRKKHKDYKIVKKLYLEMGVNTFAPAIHKVLVERGIMEISVPHIIEFCHMIRMEQKDLIPNLNIIEDDECIKILANVLPDGIRGWDTDVFMKIMDEHGIYTSRKRLAELWGVFKKWRKARSLNRN